MPCESSTLMDNEPWDFFMCLFMETDRLHHFLWEYMEKGHGLYASAFYTCYWQIDDMLGSLWERLDKDTTLIVMSDHGFCTLKQKVEINYWLAQKGWLKFEKNPPESLEDISEESLAYSLTPGRIYLNLKGREPKGRVELGPEYERVREALAESLLEMEDPSTGERMIEKALRREEIYSGPCLDKAPDLVAVPCYGYDLKGTVGKEALTFKGSLVGMHTYEDALLYANRDGIVEDGMTVEDVMGLILRLMDVGVS